MSLVAVISLPAFTWQWNFCPVPPDLFSFQEKSQVDILIENIPCSVSIGGLVPSKEGAYPCSAPPIISAPLM